MKTSVAVIAIAIMLMVASGAFADVPNYINFQGTLTDSIGNPIDGTRSMRFYIYDDSTGGSNIWAEQQDDVPINDGLFRVVLGLDNPLPANIFDGTIKWITAMISPEVIELSPRQPLVTVPYSFKTAKSDYTDDAGYADEADIANEAFFAHDANHATYSDTADYANSAGHAETADTALYSYGAVADGDWIISGNDMYSGVAGDVGIGTTSPSHPLHVVNPSNDNGSRAIHGEATSTGNGDQLWGVWGQTNGSSTGNSGAGVVGKASSSTFNAAGVRGEADGEEGKGVWGWATHTTGTNYAVYGQTPSPNGYAGYFQGGRNYFQGNVGIGYTDPTYKLQVNGSVFVLGSATAATLNTGQGDNELYDMNQNVRTTDNPTFNQLHLSDYGTALGGVHVGGTSDPGTDNLIVDGNVGIGTTSPSHPLHVVNPSNDNGSRAIHGEATSTGNGDQLWGVWGQTNGSSTGNSGAGVVGKASSSTFNAAGVRGEADGEEGKGVWGWATHTTGTNYAVYGQTPSPNGYAGYFQGGRNYFQGNVGIGYTDPTYKLQVNGSVFVLGSATAATLNTGQGDNELYDMNQNVQTTDSPSFNRVFLTDYGSALGGLHVGGTSDPGTDNLIVDGNVGIGITAPSAKLDLEGDLHVGNYDVTFGTGLYDNKIFWDNSKGALRSGRDYGGIYWAPDSVGDYSVAFGQDSKAIGENSNALGYRNTARADYSIAMGYSCETIGTHSLSIGQLNIASGWASLALGSSSEATGSSSSAIGHGTIASGNASLALGMYVTAGPADNTFVIGRGTASNLRVVNNTANSFIVGFGTTLDLFVGGANHYVGVGTGSPANKLHVFQSSGNTKLEIESNSGAPRLELDGTNASGNLAVDFQESGISKATLGWNSSSDYFFVYEGTTNSIVSKNGLVGIRTTTPEQPLDVNGDVYIGGGSSDYDGGQEFLRFEAQTDDWYMGVQNETSASLSDFYIGTDHEDGKFHIQQSNGYVGIGTTAPQEKLHVNGEVYVATMYGTASGSAVRWYNNRLYYQSSSRKYKDDIQPLDDDFNKILGAESVSFTDKLSGEKHIGFIAEEFENLGLDHLVIKRDGDPDAIRYELVSLYLLEVIKDQNAKIEELTQRIELVEDNR